MQKQWYNIILFITSLLWLGFAYADPDELGSHFYSDKTKVVYQQIDLLKNRLIQAETELNFLQQQQDNRIAALSIDKVNKQWLSLTKIDISVSKSNLDSINIELLESQQTINFLEKDTQELENQLNVFHVFGLSVARTGLPNLKNMQSQLNYQKELLKLEKTRMTYLVKLQKTAENALQLHDLKYNRIENVLKSQTIMQLKEQQSKSEVDYQEQQNTWLEHLNSLHAALKKLDDKKSKDKKAYSNLMNEIFYANENINFMYLQMLIVRYKDQIQQFKVSISRSSSITLLNKVGDQIQVLGRQFTRVSDLLKARSNIIEQRQSFLASQKPSQTIFMTELTDLNNQYKTTAATVLELNNDLIALRTILEQAIQQELSSRQGLLGLGVKTWFDLGSELIVLPTLTFQVVKSLTQAVLKVISQASIVQWILFSLLELAWVLLFYFSNRFLARIVLKIPDHELGHINPRWLSVKLIHRILIDVAIIANVYLFFVLARIPLQYYQFLLNIGIAWLIVKAIINIARLCLVETMHDRAGLDVRLYHRLKWTFLIGGIVTACSVFLHQLPLIYELKDLFYRLFLLFVAMVSLLLLKSWDVLPGLILPHIDDRRTYLRKVIRLLGLLIPLTLLVNSAIGVCGYINFVLTISWYESIFILVLVGYLVVRGILSDVMEFSSRLLIRHVTNGWLWTEAFLKPLDKILRITIFLLAGGILFFLYGWDRQSPVVERLDTLLHYHLFHLFNATITLVSFLQLFVIVSLLYWVARWTREFVYRFLLSRTKDLGIRNSIAILSQYTMILIVILIGLRVIGIDLQALTVVAGAFAFGVGLGLRDLANNFACGFLLLLERPLRVGDTVTIGGYEGEVMHIGGRAVTVRTWDHMDVLVPNAEIFSKTFTNWTAKDHIVRSVISIKIARHDNPLMIQALIYKTLANEKNLLTDPASEVFLKELGGESIDFEVRYFINLRQVPSRVGVRSQVLLKIWEVFEENGIQPPFPQHDVHIKSHMPLLPSSNMDLVPKVP